MKAISFLNRNKRMLLVILSFIFIAVMMFPTANIKLENNTNQKTNAITFLNASVKITEIKDKLGIDTIDISGIDKNNPADDIEKTNVAIYDTLNNFNYAILSAYLSMLFVVLSAMLIYVKPNSLFGILFNLVSITGLILFSYFSISGINLLNENIELIKMYFGLDPSILGITFNTSSVIIIGEIILCAMLLANLFLRKPREANNESEKLAKTLLFLCALIAILSVIFITLFLLLKGIPTISKIGFFNFVFSNKWDPVADSPKFGILNLIITSFVGTFGAILIGVPIGIFVAIFISQIVPRKLSRLLLEIVNLLAGIPSVIYGAVGAMLLVPFIQNIFKLPTGSTLFTAIIVLAIMVLPTIISVSTVSINAVPKTYLDASLALGLTKEASTFRVLIPAARSGIMTGVLLGLGRAIGEAMAIILVAGNVPGFPELFKPARFLTTGIVAEMGYATGLHRDALFAIGLVLFFFILVINSFFKMLIKKAGEKYE